MYAKNTLYISDLDGTLLNQSAEVSEYTMQALNTMLLDGLQFTIATARTLVSTRRMLDGLLLRLPVILMNGVLIYDMASQQYIKINSLASNCVGQIIAVLRRFEITGFMYELKDGEMMTYHESLEKKPLRDFVEERIARYCKKFRHTEGFEAVSHENIIYFTLFDTFERLLPVHDAIASQDGLKLTFYEDSYKLGFWFLEIFSDKASKQSAVEYLRKKYQFNEIVGFGDNLNDLPMFAASDRKVAVKNAKPEVKAAADFVCGTNEEDGVVKWLEENLTS